MLIEYELGNKKLSKKISNETFILLTNRNSGYLFFPNPSPAERRSRYMGVFFPSGKSGLFRVVSNIYPEIPRKVSKVCNRFYCIERNFRRNRERFFLPNFKRTLVYELYRRESIIIDLDVRQIYAGDSFGRFYETSLEDEIVVVKYRKENLDTKSLEHEFFIAIKSNSKAYEFINSWKKEFYSFDRDRRSPPFELHTYSLMKLKPTRVVISFGENKDSVVKECEEVYSNVRKLLSKHRRYTLEMLEDKELENKFKAKKIPKEMYFAYNSCKFFLNQMLTNDGIIAGLPWFFQYWSRDEAISAISLNKRNAKKLLLKRLDFIREDGRLPNIYYTFTKTNADAIGWLFHRIMKLLNLFTIDERRKIEEKLLTSICRINENYIKDNLVFNLSRETWMDTCYGDDARLGARIEIQALMLCMYSLASILSKLINRNLAKMFSTLEKNLKEKVKANFWTGNYLKDGSDDPTIRPNVFLAAYAYPELLSKEEWTLCFQKVLEALWLDWGGLATIDKKHELFCEEHTGEDPRSYHHGDSWYFLNNIAAIVMNSIAKEKFSAEVDAIIKASTHEILWSGALGCHSELSSASKQTSQGCLCQAWSLATYIELVKEVYGF